MLKLTSDLYSSPFVFLGNHHNCSKTEYLTTTLLLLPKDLMLKYARVKKRRDAQLDEPIRSSKSRKLIAARTTEFLEAWKQHSYSAVEKEVQKNLENAIEVPGEKSIRDMARLMAASDIKVPPKPPTLRPLSTGHRPARNLAPTPPPSEDVDPATTEYIENQRAEIAHYSTKIPKLSLVRNLMAWYKMRISSRIAKSLRLMSTKTPLKMTKIERLEIPFCMYERWVRPTLVRALGRGSAGVIASGHHAFIMTTEAQLRDVVEPRCQSVPHSVINRVQITASVLCSNDREVLFRYRRQSETLFVQFWSMLTDEDGKMLIAT